MNVIEHVVRRRHDQPFALRHIHFKEMVVHGHLPFFLTGLPSLVLSMLNALNNPVG